MRTYSIDLTCLSSTANRMALTTNRSIVGGLSEENIIADWSIPENATVRLASLDFGDPTRLNTYDKVVRKFAQDKRPMDI